MYRSTINPAALCLAGLLLAPGVLAQPARRVSDTPPTRQHVAAEARNWPAVEYRGSLTVYPDRAAFDAAHPGLPVEDFEDVAAPPDAWCASPSPVDASTNNGCISAGDIAEGLAIAATGPNQGQPDALVAWDGGVFSNPTNALGANFFSDDTEVRFDPGVAAAAMDVYAIGDGTVHVTVYDPSGNLLGSADIPAPSLRFVGVSSGAAPIGRIHLGLPQDLTLVDDIAFGEAAGCALDLTATISGTTVSPGDVLTFGVTVTNTSDAPVPASLDLVATGPVSRTIGLAAGAVPAGATVSRNLAVRVPTGAPAGTYDVVLDLDAAGSDCAAEAFAVTVTAPRVGPTTAGRSGPFEVIGGGDLFAPASSVGASAPAARVSPNPFAGRTRITFEAAEASHVRLAVYDVLGREVAVLVDGRVESGSHTVTFVAQGLPAGTYVYRLDVGGDVQTGRMTLTR
jgi:hypothetical protein